MKIRFSLSANKYCIDLTRNYCGAVASNFAGAGRDLRDGPLWKFPRVLWDIVCYELRIGRWSPNYEPVYPVRSPEEIAKSNAERKVLMEKFAAQMQDKL